MSATTSLAPWKCKKCGMEYPKIKRGSSLDTPSHGWHYCPTGKVKEPKQ